MRESRTHGSVRGPLAEPETRTTSRLRRRVPLSGRRLTVGGARSALPAERLIFTAALARSTADSSPAVHSASSTPPLNPVMY